MSQNAIIIQTTEVRSSQEWTKDPDMISITLTAEFLERAAKCVEFMKGSGVNTMTIWWAFDYELYGESDGVEEIIVGDNGVEYAVFTPEYALDGCHAKVFDDGRIRAVLPFDNTNDKLWVDIGCLDELRTKLTGKPSVSTVDSSRMCERLLDPMEYRDGSFVPSVANDAVKVIQHLTTALKATQTAHSQTMQYVERADKFVARTAALSIWGHDRNDGTPYEECEEPSEGYADSHECLMNLIEAARDVQEVTA